MAKKSIAVAERYYIENNPDGLSTKELATMFGRTEQTVRNIQTKAKKTKEPKVEAVDNVVEQQQTAPVPTGDIDISKAMGKIAYQRQPNTIIGAVMTPTASQLSDEIRGRGQRPLSETLKGSIHKPRG